MYESLGILGVGHLAGYMVAALRRVKDNRRIVLSPRNQARAKELKSTYECHIAKDNQSVVDECNVLLLSVRPDHLEDIAAEIAPTPDHLVISCVAGVSMQRLQVLMPNTTIVRTLPLASAEVGEGVVPLFPENSIAQALLNPIGKLMVFDSESDYELAATAAVINGVLFGFMAELSEWFQSKGLAAEQARALVIHTLRGATGLADRMPDQSLRDINLSIAGPGTFTRKAQDIIIAGEGFESWLKACEYIQRRFSEKSV